MLKKKLLHPPLRKRSPQRCPNVVFPFTAELGVSIGQFLFIIGIAEFTGMLCAFLGPLFDALGPRAMFACGQTLNAVGLLIPALSQSYWPVFAGWLLFEAAYNIIAPAIQAAMTTAIDDPSRVRGFFCSVGCFLRNMIFILFHE